MFERYDETVVAPLNTALKTVVRAGKDAGEIRVDVDENLLVDVLASTRRDLDGTGSQRLVDLVFDGVCPT